MAKIVDQHGRPIETRSLREPQTARLASLHQEFAEHPARGLTPARLSQILTAAEQGDLLAQFDLFDDMEERDAHIYAEMAKRRRALLTVDWRIEPPRNASPAETKAAAMAEEMLGDLAELEDVLLDALDAIGKGFACLEVEWSMVGREWSPSRIQHRPQRWFQLDRATRSEIRLRDGSTEGEALNAGGWIVHVHRARSGYLARAGLHRVLCWPYVFKNYAVRDLAEFLEIYGLPLRVGTYPPGASDAEKATLLSAVVGIGHAAAGIIPEGMMLEFKEAAQGQSDPYQAMIDWCERSVSKAIVGQTLSAESKSTGLGSGVADLHGEVRRDITQSDARQLAQTLTRDLVFPLVALNGAGAADPRRTPKVVFDFEEAEDIKSYSDSLPALAKAGVRIPVKWVHEKLRIPEPEGDEPVLGGVAADDDRDSTASGAPGAKPPGSPAKPGAPGRPAAGAAAADDEDDEEDDEDTPPARAAMRAANAPAPVVGAGRGKGASSTFPDQEAVDQVVDAISVDELQREIEPMVAPLIEMVRAGESAEAILSALAESYPQLDTATLQELLARAMFAVEAFGRLSAQSE
jgi:phage gp29-like protein